MRALSRLCVAVLTTCLFAGCGKSPEKNQVQAEKAPPETPQPVAKPTADTSGSASKAEPTGSATKAKPAGSATKAETKTVSGSAPKDDASTAAVDVEKEPYPEPPPEPEVDVVDPAIAGERLEAIPVFDKAERVGDVIESAKDVRINYTHTSAPMKVHDYYRMSLRKDGWQMGRPQRLDDDGNAISFFKDGQMILVVIEGLGEHSVRMLTGPQ